MRNTVWYSKFAKAIAHFCGRPRVFVMAVLVIVTFLMVFLIQNTQIRDTEAMQVKLDELIRATRGAHNALLDLEELEEDTLESFRQRYQALATAARADLIHGVQDTGTPEP
jgi:low affinity Fe/Cu permease